MPRLLKVNSETVILCPIFTFILLLSNFFVYYTTKTPQILQITTSAYKLPNDTTKLPKNEEIKIPDLKFEYSKFNELKSTEKNELFMHGSFGILWTLYGEKIEFNRWNELLQSVYSIKQNLLNKTDFTINRKKVNIKTCVIFDTESYNYFYENIVTGRILEANTTINVSNLFDVVLNGDKYLNLTHYYNILKAYNIKNLAYNNLLNYSNNKFIFKIYATLESPFDNTLFLDIDTYCVNPRNDVYNLFKLLNTFDFISTHDWNSQRQSITPQYILGIFAYQMNLSVKSIFTQWLINWYRYSKFNKPPSRDQESLVYTLNRPLFQDFKSYIIPPEWTCELGSDKTVYYWYGPEKPVDRRMPARRVCRFLHSHGIHIYRFINHSRAMEYEK